MSLRTVYQRVSAHRGVIVLLLIFAFCVYPLIDLGKFGPTRVAFRVILVMFIASQFFWIRRALDLGERFIPGEPRRVWLTAIACFVELLFFVYSYTHMGGVVHLFLASKIIGAADPRLRSVLMEGALSWWLAAPVLGFGLVRPGSQSSQPAIIFWPRVVPFRTRGRPVDKRPPPARRLPTSTRVYTLSVRNARHAKFLRARSPRST